MGLFSGGNSKSSTTNNTTTNNAGFSDLAEGAVVTSVQGNNNTLLDGGAIKAAFDYAQKSGSESYDFARDVAASTSNTVSEAVAAVSESARTETENIFLNLQKYALYGLVVWGVVQVVKRAK